MKNKKIKSKKIKIGIDLDDTIWSFRKKFSEYYNDKFGTNHNFDNHNKSIEEFLAISKKESIELFEEFNSSKYSSQITLIEGFKEVYEELIKFYELIFITARPIHLAESTINKINGLLGINNSHVHFTHDETWTRVKDKATYCIEHGVSILIEDSYENVILCSKKGIKCFLLNYPWNEGEINENIIRVNNWEEIKDYLLGGKNV